MNPTFSIRVAELTKLMLETIPSWVLHGPTFRYAVMSVELALEPNKDKGVIDWGGHVFGADVLCYPCQFTADGGITRLECPRMPDELEIDAFRDCTEKARCVVLERREDQTVRYRLEVAGIRLTHWVLPPSRKHYARRTYEGIWVWSTRTSKDYSNSVPDSGILATCAPELRGVVKWLQKHGYEPVGIVDGTPSPDAEIETPAKGTTTACISIRPWSDVTNHWSGLLEQMVNLQRLALQVSVDFGCIQAIPPSAAFPNGNYSLKFYPSKEFCDGLSKRHPIGSR